MKLHAVEMCNDLTVRLSNERTRNDFTGCSYMFKSAKRGKDTFKHCIQSRPRIARPNVVRSKSAELKNRFS